MLNKVDIIDWWNHTHTDRKTSNRVDVQFVDGAKAPEMLGKKRHYCPDLQVYVPSTKRIEVGKEFKLEHKFKSILELQTVEIKIPMREMSKLKLTDLDRVYVVIDKQLRSLPSTMTFNMLNACSGWCYKHDVKI